jgi:hypothetical protein
MTRKFALLIGNSQYQDPVLAKFKAPDSDVAALTQILEDPAIGAFDQVIPVLGEKSSIVSVAIGDFFAEKKREDLLLLYFSGHGVLDENDRFYLAVKDTQHDRLSATGIASSFIKGEMESCRSERQVLILDCCHSGAFARGKGAGLNAITRATFESPGCYGQVVLTATDATQYVWEGDQVIGNVQTSLFTHFLIEGLRTGQADSDRDGRITLAELYDYVYEHVRTQTPQQTPRKWEQAGEGEELVIARSHYRPTGLPSGLRRAIENTSPYVREDAVGELGQLLRGSDKSLARLAHGILKAMAKEDDSFRIRDAAFTVLKTFEETKPRKVVQQVHTSQVPIIPSSQKKSASIPGVDLTKLPPAQRAPVSPKRNWFLWGGIGTGILISIVIFLLGSFATHPPPIPPSDTSTSTLTTLEAETLTSTLFVTSLPTNTPPILATDTPILPTTMIVLPTRKLVPSITSVPSNTPTPVPPTLTPSPQPTQTQLQCIQPPYGLISWWPGDGNANDIIGSNNGTLVGDVTFSAGEVGQAFSFDGIDDIVLARATGFPTGTAPRTVSFWSKISSLNDHGTGFAYGTEDIGKGFYLFPSHYRSGGQLAFSGHGADYDVLASTDLRDGLYHHVAVTYDGAIITIYADGVGVASGSLNLDTGISGGASIGGRAYGGEFLTGEVDEVAVWNRVLSASEIQAMFSAGSAGMCK